MSDSIGKVKAQNVTLEGKFELECGQSFNDIELVYETYGVLNADATNAILICHALSGNHHAAGKYENEENQAGGILLLAQVKLWIQTNFL